MTCFLYRTFYFYALSLVLSLFFWGLTATAQAESYRIVTAPDYSRPELIKVYINGRYMQNESPYENELYTLSLPKGKYLVEVVRLLDDKNEYFGTTKLDTNSYDNSSIFLNLKKRRMRSTQHPPAFSEPTVERVPTASLSTLSTDLKSPTPAEKKQDEKIHLDKEKKSAEQARLIAQETAKKRAQAGTLEKIKQAELEREMREMTLKAEAKIAATQKALQQTQAKAEQQLAATEKALQEAQKAAEKQLNRAKKAQKRAEEQLLAAQKLSQTAEKISKHSVDKINTKPTKSSDDVEPNDKIMPQTKYEASIKEKPKSISDGQLAQVSRSNLLVEERSAIKDLVDDASLLELETILLYRAMALNAEEKPEKPKIKIGHYATLNEQQALKKLQKDIRKTVKTFDHESRSSSSVLLRALLDEAEQQPMRVPAVSRSVEPKDTSQKIMQSKPRLKSSVWPQMVMIPAGHFVMGCQHKRHCTDEEKPAHKVSVKAFRLARTEVTFKQWGICVEAGVCPEIKDDRDWGRGERPVINVSWDDTQKYVNWLSDEKGKKYRLPTEKEWEYAARAGTKTLFFNGDCLTTKQANFNSKLKDKLSVECASQDQQYREKTLKVAHFKANKWGLYDMHGNVWEWAQNCWYSSYESDNKEKNKSRLKSDPVCKNRVLRGGAWHSPANNLRSSYRFRYSPDTRSFDVGFRVASDI